MKKLALSLVLLIGVLFAISAFAESPIVVTPPAPVLSVPVAPAPLSIFDFVKAHLAALALVVYAILDVVIIAIPSLKGNGLVNQILIMAGKLSGQNPPA